ncbi:BsuPI-related putative proteinase inhibitor [Dehalococcoidia bacterium]|nr:BsuPI-related putative proteinase inhibitor [Dehalococcoidia bacterium]MCL0097944.1 BsuPI-related putative proteinase inhibitor [Dehalococcoidia bacterium]
MLKKRVFLALLIVSLVLPAGCPVPEPAPEQPADRVTTVFSEIKEGLKLELSLPRVSYRPGEILQASLSLINTTQDAISFETRTSQLFDLIIEGPGMERRWSEDKMFLQVITPHHIAAGERLSDVLSWEIKLSPGDFYLTGLTVPFELNGERILLETTRLKITVE